MTDRLQPAYDLIALIAPPFGILIACGLFAVAIHMLRGVAHDLKKDSRSIGFPSSSSHNASPAYGGGRRQTDRLARASASQAGTATTGLLVVGGVGCLVAAMYIALGVVALLVSIAVVLLFAAAYRVGSQEHVDGERN